MRIPEYYKKIGKFTFFYGNYYVLRGVGISFIRYPSIDYINTDYIIKIDFWLFSFSVSYCKTVETK